MHGSIAAVLDAALESLRTPLEPEPIASTRRRSAGRLALEYLAACLDGEFTAAAAQRSRRPVEDGAATPQDIYCRVLMPAQKEIGRLWHRGDLSVAEERLVSETTRRMMARLAARYQPQENRTGKCSRHRSRAMRTILGCAPQATCLRSPGGVAFISVPTFRGDIALTVQTHGIDLVLLAATLETQLGASAETIATIKRAMPSCKTVIGGMAVDDAAAVFAGRRRRIRCADRRRRRDGRGLAANGDP